MTLARAIALGTLATLALGGISGVWAFGDSIGERLGFATVGEVDEVRQIAQSNQRRLDSDRYFFLDKKAGSVGLSQAEKFEICELARRLGFAREGCL